MWEHTNSETVTTTEVVQTLKSKLTEYRSEEMRDYLKYLDLADHLESECKHQDACTVRMIAHEENMHAFLLGRILES